MDKRDRFAVITSPLLPLAIAGLLYAFFSPTAGFVTLAVYVIGGLVTLVVIKKDRDNPLVMFTGWYAGPLCALLGLPFLIIDAIRK